MKKNILFILWIVLSVLSSLYGIMVLGANSGSDFYIVWLAIGVVFAFFAVAVKLSIWDKLKNPIKIIFLSCVGLGVTIVTFFEILVFTGFNKTAPDGLDYIIVLGAQVHEDRPSVVLKYRLDKAIDYLSGNPDTICIVSGGKGDYEPFSEAEGMADYLIKKGISPERIILEANSRDTFENIRYSKQSIPTHCSVGIVTNNFHIFRALQIARDEGLKNVYGIAADSRIEYLPNNCFREFFGEGKYLLKRLYQSHR